MGKLVAFTKANGEAFTVDCEAVKSVSQGGETGTSTLYYAMHEHGGTSVTVVGTPEEVSATLNAAMGT